jgi:hypothetical protein
MNLLALVLAVQPMFHASATHLRHRVTDRRTTTCASLLTSTRVFGDPLGRVPHAFEDRAAHARPGRKQARLTEVVRAFRGETERRIVASAGPHGSAEIARFFARTKRNVNTLANDAEPFLFMIKQRDPRWTSRLAHRIEYGQAGYGYVGLGLFLAWPLAIVDTLQLVTHPLAASTPTTSAALAMLVVSGVLDGAIRHLTSVDRSVEDLERVARDFVAGEAAGAEWHRDFSFSADFVRALEETGLTWGHPFIAEDRLELSYGQYFIPRPTERMAIDVVFSRLDGAPVMNVVVSAGPSEKR